MVRLYSKYTISYRQLKEMIAEHGVVVDHATIWRWVQRYAPQLEYQGYTSGSWRVDKTCIRVNGELAEALRTRQHWPPQVIQYRPEPGLW
jgi:transposase, IS6 family